MEIKDIHWLAGLLEGEGCFGLSSGCIRISVHMTDEDIINRAAEILGARVRKEKLQPNRKQCWATAIYSSEAAGWMMTLYSLMGKRRKETIENALVHWKQQRRKNKQGHGRRNPRCASEVSCVS